MPSSPQTYKVRTISFNRDEVAAYLATAAGFDPRNTTMVPGEIYKDGFDLEERKLEWTTSSDANRDPFVFQDTILMQLGEWHSSKRDGNLMAIRAHDLIVAQAKKIADLEAQLEETK